MSNPNPIGEDDWNCEYWSEVEANDSQTYEFCRRTKKQCSCSGMKIECNNGEYMPQIIEPE